MVYKYGTTVLVKPETKERLQNRGKIQDSYDVIITKLLDKVDEYERLVSYSKEHRMTINRLLRELPENQQKEVDSMKDSEGKSKIPLEIGAGGDSQ